MTSPMKHQGTPTKLRSGNWGVRIEYMGVQPGDIVEVTTRRGDTWECYIECISYKGNGITICSTGKRIDSDPTTTPTVQSTTTTTGDTGTDDDVDHQGTPSKLPDGKWGVRIKLDDTPVENGQKVRVTTRGGKVWVSEISGIGRTYDDGYVIVETRRIDGTGKPDTGRRVYRQYTGDGYHSRGPKFEEDEGSSFPCHVCGGFCFSGDNGYCSRSR